jgi:hypothetical protein
MNANADILQHVRMLLKNSVSIEVKGREVWVAAPEAHAIHKIIIFSERGRIKKDGDLQSIESLLPLLNPDKTKKVLSELDRVEIDRVVEFFNKHPYLSAYPFNILAK